MPKRFAVLSDVHGNLPALDAILSDIAPLDLDGLWVLGDLVGGPGQNEVYCRLRDLGAVFIRGNNEDYLLQYYDGHTSARRECQQWALTRWAYHDLDPDILQFIAGLPEQRVVQVDDGVSVRLVHGSPKFNGKSLYPDQDQERIQHFREAGLTFYASFDIRLADAVSEIDESVLLCGHTHIPWMQWEGDLLVLNPGAVGVQVDGTVGAQYALLTWDGQWHAAFKSVPYDWSALHDLAVESGFLEQAGAMARALLLTAKTGQNASLCLVRYAFALAAEAGVEAQGAVPDHIWAHAVETFDWERAASGQVLF